MDQSWQIRYAAFQYLEAAVADLGEVLPRTLLERGFEFDGQRIHLIGPQGIFKPAAISDAPLSITTSPQSPYSDQFKGDSRILYSYRGTDPRHHENVGLRKAMQAGIPLIYFFGIEPGRYFTTWPVYIVDDDPGRLTFTVEVDEKARLNLALGRETNASNIAYAENDREIRRRYATRQVLQRLHQQSFRERVLAAYRERCAMCTLKHRELLDAAHIIADADEGGEPEVSNGLSLCKLHHAAFDRNFVGIRPKDLRIIVRRDILDEEDGPMLQHGLKGLHGVKLKTPRKVGNRPDLERLGVRYSLFQERQDDCSSSSSYTG